MGKVCVTEDYLQDIADAIREKGVTGTFTPAQMGDAVRQISGGGGVAVLERLFYGYETEYKSDQPTPQVLENHTEYEKYSEYLETNDYATWTVKKDFCAIVTIGVMQDPNRSGSGPYCTLYVNGLDISTVEGGEPGVKVEKIIAQIFHENDTFYFASELSNAHAVRLGAVDLIDSVDMSGYTEPDWE